MKRVNLYYSSGEGKTIYCSDPEPKTEYCPASIDENGRIITAVSTTSSSRPHHGTHLDFPNHKIKDGKKPKDYHNEFEKFFNNCFLIDLTSYSRETIRSGIDSNLIRKVSQDINFDLLNLEYVHALLFRTGYEDIIRANTPQDYNFPFFEKDAAEEIANWPLKLNVVGMDSPAFDKKGSDSGAHLAFLRKDILILESAVNLDILKDELRRGRKIFKLNTPIIYHDEDDSAKCPAYAETIF